MPLLNSLATPYADALLQVGEAAGGADALAVEAKALLDAWHSSADLQGAMRSPCWPWMLRKVPLWQCLEPASALPC